jgi:hypothetical protein
MEFDRRVGPRPALVGVQALLAGGAFARDDGATMPLNDGGAASVTKNAPANYGRLM